MIQYLSDFFENNKLAVFNLLSLLGLILDIIGAIWLFKLKDNYFNRLNIGFKINRKTYVSSKTKNEDLVNSAIRALKKELNDMFSDVTEKNRRVNKKANKAFLLIVLGFSIQSLAIILQCIS